MCSAAYYIGSASAHIVANKRAEAIGSIGAYAQFLDLSGFYEKKGAKLITVYAHESTEKNKSYRDLMSGNPKTYIKEDLNPIVEQDFISDMKAVIGEEYPKRFLRELPTMAQKLKKWALSTK